MRSSYRQQLRRTPSQQAVARRARLQLENLEDRVVPVIISPTMFGDEDSGSLLPTSGLGRSLREAIKYSAAGDVIQLSAGVYTLSLAGAGENLGSTGDLDVLHQLDIVGPITCNAVIDANGIDRVLDVHNVSLMMQNTEIRNGNAFLDPGTRDGGGLRSRGAAAAVNLLTCNRIYNNQAESGGGIANENGAMLRMSNAQVYLNYAQYNGGGLFNMAQASAVGSQTTFTSNVGGDGGAVFNAANANLTFLNGSQVNGNVSLFNGGGIYNEASFLGIMQSTVGGNFALANGGGLYGIVGQIRMDQSSVNNNFALGDGGGLSMQNINVNIQNSTFSTNFALANGGGIAIAASPPLMMLHTTVAQNYATAGAGLFTGPSPFPIVHRSVIAENYAFTSLLDDVTGFLDPSGTWNMLTSGLHGLVAGTNFVSPVGTLAPLGTCTGSLTTAAHDLLPISWANNRLGGPPTQTVDQLGKPRGLLPDSGACESNPAFQPSGPDVRPLDDFILGDFFVGNAGAVQPWAQAVRHAWDFLTAAPTDQATGVATPLDGTAVLPRADAAVPGTEFELTFAIAEML